MPTNSAATAPLQPDLVAQMAERHGVSTSRVLVWEKAGQHHCAQCKEPILIFSGRLDHLRFDVSNHELTVAA